MVNKISFRQVRNGQGYAGSILDLEMYMARSPNNARQASTTFANNVAAGSEINVVMRKSFKMPDFLANDNSWIGTIPFDNPAPFLPGQDMSWRVVIHATTFASNYVMDCFSDWRTGVITSYPGCAYPGGTGNALLNSTYRSPGNVHDFLSYPRFATPVPGTPMLFTLGNSNSDFSGVPLPFDMTPLGAPGCMLVNNWLIVLVGVTTTSTFVPFYITFPDDPNLVGATYYAQSLFFDPGANALGIWTTNGRINANIPAPVGITRIYANSAAAVSGTVGLDFALPVGLN